MTVLPHAYQPTVFLLDGDPAVRQMMAALARTWEWPVEIIPSIEEFLDASNPLQPGCLVADIHSPGMSGGGFLENFRRAGMFYAIVVLSPKTDVPTAVRMMKAGAVAFLEKPLEQDALEAAVEEALRIDAEFRQRQMHLDRIRRRLKKLNDGENDVLKLLLTGKMNREIADSLTVSVRTVEVRRAKIMEKMKAPSLAELIRETVYVELSDEHRFW
jgi:FixJ family two-component response regulator